MRDCRAGSRWMKDWLFTFLHDVEDFTSCVRYVCLLFCVLLGDFCCG